MVADIKKNIFGNLINIPGWRTQREIVVIESDDWGAIRMPSSDSYHKLLSKGIGVDRSFYDRFDVLESGDDLAGLFEVLKRYRDKRGNHPVMTFNTVMGNPDFERIGQDMFNRYHFEHFTDTYRRYYGSDLMPLWKSAVEEGLIRPQFHAKEHLNVSLWMEALRRNDRDVKTAFEHNFFGLRDGTPSDNQAHYLAAYWVEGIEDFHLKKKILKEGLDLFEKTFGYRSESFVACNYIFPQELESMLFECGVKFIQGQRGHLSPDIYTGKKRVRRTFTGKRNSLNHIYLVRNCQFEPSSDWNKDWVGSCLLDMERSFRWGKPAIISTHRINYVGGLSEENRERGLTNLNKLIQAILKTWPNVEFMSTEQLGIVIDTND